MVDDNNDDLLEDDSSFDDHQSVLDEDDSIIDQEEEEEEEIEKIPSQPPPAKETQPFTKPTDIPLQVSIEFGRKYLSLKELSELQPGNLLTLDPPVGDHIYLVINGKRIGRGEIMKIGESIGVRVTELG